MGKFSSSENEIDIDVVGHVLQDTPVYTTQHKRPPVVIHHEGRKKVGEILADHEKYSPPTPDGLPVQCDINDEVEHRYDMSSFPRGVCIIFNMHTFHASTDLQEYPRTGTHKDKQDVQDLFLRLGFVVYVFNNVTKDELITALRELSKIHSALSCFTCFILSHGTDGHFFTSDTLVKLTHTFTVLENPLWVGKPKLFFIQACQGDKYMDGMQAEGLDQVDSPPDTPTVLLPTQSDFLFAYSTPSGYASWRNSKQGSWFVQDICKSFYKYSHRLDLLRILTRANDTVALRTTHTEKEETNEKRQIASVVTQLRKDLYFFPPYDSLNKRYSTKVEVNLKVSVV